MRWLSLTESDICSLARRLGHQLRPGHVVLLDGGLGAGKTTFVRALALGLGVDHPQRVRSPTFALSLVHPGPVSLVHVDLYRLGGSTTDEGVGGLDAAFESLGLDENVEFAQSRGEVVVVEWAALSSFAGIDALSIHLERPTGHFDIRHLSGESTGQRSANLLAAWTAA